MTGFCCEPQDVTSCVTFILAGISISSHIAATCNLCSLDQFQNKSNGVLYTDVDPVFLVLSIYGHRITLGCFDLSTRGDTSNWRLPSRIHQHL